MRLSRTVYSGCGVYYDDAARMLPDVAITPTPGADGELVVTDKCLMVVDAGSGEAVGVLLTRADAEELARIILAPTVEVARTIPGRLLTNGDGPAT